MAADGSQIVRQHFGLDDPATMIKAQGVEFGDRSLIERIQRTLDLASGFESAYGLELLATVHWCATRNAGVESAADAAECVRAWNYRKGRLFTEEHIEVAWDHLKDQGWIGEREPALS